MDNGLVELRLQLSILLLRVAVEQEVLMERQAEQEEQEDYLQDLLHLHKELKYGLL
jgi:hypothetical protein